MTQFRYSALTVDGKKVSGSLEAASRREANLALRERGMHVTAIKAAGVPLTSGIARVSGGRSELTYLFTSHMRRLLRARLPLLEALDATGAELRDSPAAPVVARIRGKVAGGLPLADALGAEPDYFDELYVSMVRAAQASGTLAAAFDSIYVYQRRRREFRRRLTSALAYPVVLIVVAVLAVMFLMSYVVPRIASALRGANIPLPAITRLLLAVSDFAKVYWWAVLAVLVILALLPGIAGRFKAGRLFADRALIGLPFVRRFSRSAIVARFCKTFAALLGTGLRVADALEVAGKVSGNSLFEKAVAQAKSRIVSGGELALSLKESGLFPNYAVQIVSIGEKTGTLTESFDEIARSEDEDLQATTERFLTFLEPAVIVFMAVAVGFIVASVLLPIMSLSSIGST